MYRSILLRFSAAIMVTFVAVNAYSQQAESRLWKDSTGKFQVRATLLEQTDSSVRLRTADGREISVLVDRLSQEDQDYLQSLNAPNDNPFAGGTPLSKDPTKVAPTPSAAVPGTLR